ncbi:uncharacterized protein ARMOST_21345 [Armillaria ostoyae]|uniref:Uncharacterized protein n=1 Tax=Armillaria ostoyae TaxID=47428 RepID=A0A284S9V0_ARMOS|nr:uncharacterized protein ARMOST_21345 [Armillaria ostoyae]
MSLKSGGEDLFHGPDLEDFLFHFHDGKVNEAIELALLHGIYTGIVSVTLWNIFINKSRPIGRAMVAIIILLYIATTINVSLNWALLHSVGRDTYFIENYLDLVQDLNLKNRIPDMGIGITAAMSTVVADSAMIWRCWLVWGRRWCVVLVPIICLVIGFVFKILEIIVAALTSKENVFFLVAYLSCILATTLWCTIFIVFRIVTVMRENNKADSRLGDYHHVIEVLVESSALHSVTLIIYVALEARNNPATSYFDTLAAITTGVAPTLLAGRVAAGSTRPNDSWEGRIIVSSLRFKARPQANVETCSQEGSMGDLEAQSEQVDESEEISVEKRI